jgi:hypothetical protein
MLWLCYFQAVSHESMHVSHVVIAGYQYALLQISFDRNMLMTLRAKKLCRSTVTLFMVIERS